MSKKRYLSIFAFLLAVLFAFALGFGLSACGKDKDEDDDDKGSTTPTHTHSYVLDEDADWEWSDDFSTYTHAATCTNEDGLCDAVNGVISAEVTHDTTEATCLVDGEIVHTAKYNGDTLDTQKETIKAVGQHDITTTWTWDTMTETPTATLTFACSKGDLGVQTVTATVTYNEKKDEWDATYTATDGKVYEDSIDAGLAEPVYTYTVKITTTTTSYTEGDEEQLGATVYYGSDATSEEVAWSVEAEPEGCVTVDNNGLLKAIGAGTATITATYTYDGETATDTLDITVTAKTEDPDNPDTPGETGVFQYFVDQLNVEKGTKTGGTDDDGDAVAIEDNNYFTITSPDVELEYNDGTSSTHGMATDGKEPSATVADGTTKTFSLGLKQSNATEMDGTNKTPAFVVTANQDITLYLYVGLVNDSHNSDKPGTIYYEINGVQSGSQYQSSRQSVVTIAVELSEGDVLTVYAVPDYKTTTKTENDETVTVQDTAKMWLYGAEAVYTIGAEGETAGEHTHTYGNPVWAWEQETDGTWTCATVTITCEGCEDTADGHTLTASATVTSETSGATCTQQTVVYTAKATLNGQEIEDTKTETIAASANHQYEAEFTWTPTEEGFSVSVTFTCSVCGTSYTDASSAQVSGPDASGIYTATISDSYDNTFTNTYDPNDGIYFVSIEDSAHMTAKVGDSFTLAATVKGGHGDVVTPADGSVTWSTDTNNLITLSAESGDITCDATGTAVVYAIYTDSEGNTWTSDPYYILISATKTTPEGDQYDTKIDFSDAEGLGVGTSQMVALDEDSTLTYVDIDLEGKVENGVLETNSFTKYGSTTYTNYILVDFSQFSGYSFELQITFIASATNTTMAVVNALVENDGGYGQSSSIFGDTAPDLSDEIYSATYEGSETTLTYSGTVSSANETVYIVWNGPVMISSISLELWTGERKNTLPSDVYEVSVDLTNGASEEESQGGSLDEYGFIELVDLTGQTGFKEGYFSTAYDNYSTGYTYTFAGGADDEAALTNYIVINLAGHEYASITLMVGEGSSAGIVAIDSVAEQIKDNENSGNIVASSASSTGLLAWAGDVAGYGDQLFIVYSADIKIYSISLKFDDRAGGDAATTADYTIEIDNQNVELYVNGNGAILIAKVTYNGEAVPGATVSWSSENESVLRVDANGIATAVATTETATVKVTAAYTDPTGTTYTAEITVTVNPDPNEGEEDDGTLKVNIDFTDANNTSLMANLGTDKSIARDVYLDDSHVLRYIVTNNGAQYSYGWDTTNGYFATGNSNDAGLTRYIGGDITNYFVIDIAGSGAAYMELEIELESRYDYNLNYNSTWIELTDTLHYFTAQTGYGQQSAQPLGGTAIEYFSTSDGKMKFSWSGDVSEYSTLYLVYTTSLNIYNINIKLSGIETSDEKGEMVSKTDTVDFTLEETRSSVALTAGETIAITDIISLHVGEGSEYVAANDGAYALYMELVTESNVTESAGTYFIIDASGLGGQTITITVTWSGQQASGNYCYDIYLAVGTSMSTGVSAVGGDTLAFAHRDLVASETLTFTITVPRDATELYIYQPGGSNHYAGYIYSVTVEYETEASGESGEAGSAEKTEVASFGADLTDHSDSIWQDWFEMEDVMSDSTGKLTYTDYGVESGDSSSPYLMTGTDGGGYTVSSGSSDTGYTNYFAIDLSEYLTLGYDIEITINFSLNGTSQSGSLALSSELYNCASGVDTGSALGSQAATQANNPADFTWSGSIDESVGSDGCIYIVYDADMRIYSISVTVLG